MLKNVKNVIAKIKSSTKRNLALLTCFLLCTPIAFADLGNLKDKVVQEMAIFVRD